MAFTPFDKGRDGQTENNRDRVCVIRTHFCCWVVVLERTFEGPVQDGLSFAVSSGTFPSCTRLNQNLRFCLLLWFVCLFVCQNAEQPTGRLPPDCEGQIICELVLFSQENDMWQTAI